MTRERIAVFHGKGRDFLKALKAVRDWRDGADICGVFPANYRPTAKEIELMDAQISVQEEAYSPRNWRACLGLIREIRGERYDWFVILFNSTQLRILAHLVGARNSLWCRVDGRMEPLRGGLPWALLEPAIRMAWGRIAYSLIWLITHSLKVKRKAQ